jgi:hypothetical protein
MVLANKSGVRRHMRDACVLPEHDFKAPVILVPGAGRYPDLQAHVLRFAAGVTNERAKLLEGGERLVPRCVIELHVPVAELSNAAKSCLRVSPEPDGNATSLWTQSEAGII